MPVNKEFIKLRKEWYKKLEKADFEDIEHVDFNRPDYSPLKTWTGLYSEGMGEVYNTAAAEYYRLASQFIHTHKFETKMEKKMWELHADGKSVRDIAKLIPKICRHWTNKRRVHETIQKLRKIMLDEFNRNNNG